MVTADKVMTVLVNVTGENQIAENLNLRLYDNHILDSLKTVELIVAFSQEFGVDISPAELEREDWATPEKIVSYLENKARV